MDGLQNKHGTTDKWKVAQAAGCYYGCYGCYGTMAAVALEQQQQQQQSGIWYLVSGIWSLVFGLLPAGQQYSATG